MPRTHLRMKVLVMKEIAIHFETQRLTAQARNPLLTILGLKTSRKHLRIPIHREDSVRNPRRKECKKKCRGQEKRYLPGFRE